MPLSHEYKCLFIHIPRTGGTSFRKILDIDKDTAYNATYADASWDQINGEGLLSVCHKNPALASHKTPRILHKEHLCMKHIFQLNIIDRNIFDEYLKFAFVRNPWDKALSVYTNHYHMYCKSFEDYVNKLPTIVPFINENFTFDIEDVFYENYSRIVFNTLHNKDLEFAHKPWPGDEVIVDPQFFPQHLFIYDEHGNQLVNVIGRFETYADDAQKILDWLNISNPIEKIHASDHSPYREVYTPRMKDIIADVFAKDIEMFGYEF